jgi:hypothetical protein
MNTNSKHSCFIGYYACPERDSGPTPTKRQSGKAAKRQPRNLTPAMRDIDLTATTSEMSSAGFQPYLHQTPKRLSDYEATSQPDTRQPECRPRFRAVRRRAQLAPFSLCLLPRPPPSSSTSSIHNREHPSPLTLYTMHSHKSSTGSPSGGKRKLPAAGIVDLAASSSTTAEPDRKRLKSSSGADHPGGRKPDRPFGNFVFKRPGTHPLGCVLRVVAITVSAHWLVVIVSRLPATRLTLAAATRMRRLVLPVLVSPRSDHPREGPRPVRCRSTHT